MYDALLSYIRRTFPTKAYSQGKISGPMKLSEARFYAKGLRRLSDHFNGLESLAAQNYLALKPYRSAYLLYFFPANWVKLQTILAASSPFPPQSQYRILDLGSGAGALSLATVDYLFRRAKSSSTPSPTPSFHLTLVDQSASALQDAKALAHELLHTHGIRVELATLQSSIFNQKPPALPHRQYDIVLMGDCLNEIDAEQHFPVLDRWGFHVLAPQGRLIVLEPALQVSARALQRLRDLIVKNINNYQVLAPCFRQRLCPLNYYNKRDWCHFYAHWEQPQWMGLLEKEAGLRKDWLKYAYLVIGKPESAQKGKGAGEDFWRVISNPMRSKGKQEMVLCGPQGRVHMTAQYKNSSFKNKDFFDLQRGDSVVLDAQEWPALRSGQESWDHRLHVQPESKIVRS